MSDGSCIFCAIAAGEAPATRIDEDERTVTFLDLAPATEGHALVIPRRHGDSLLELDDEEVAACARAVRRVARRQREALGAAGVSIWQANGRAAGQTVFHYHVHVIPRYPADAVRLPWEPRPATPEALAAVAARYRGEE